uniref:Haemolymph juvenile hormone binding protein n=1 Tax=Glossina brevipalpis TaxID=37001 RepID=A0A1A9W4G4_9MUSC
MLKISYYLSGFLVLSSINEIFCGVLPSNIPKCKVSDYTCITSSINEVFRLYPKGSPSFGLDDLTRIIVPKISLGGNDQPSNAQLNVNLNNLIFSGVENSKCLNVSGFDPDIKRVQMHFLMPHLKIKADYEINGKILFLTLNGKGPCDMVLKNVNIKLTSNIGLEKKQDHTFAIVKDMKVDFVPQDFHIHFENLFDGNKELTDSVNDVINENWRDIFHVLRDSIRQAFYESLRPFISKILDVLPYDELYKD